MTNAQLLQIAISRSKDSASQSKFPAGAVVAADYLGKPSMASDTSGNEADFRHAEVRAIEKGVNMAERRLEGAVLYASMEPCLMCLTTAYWSGIRKIVYAIRRSEVDDSYYESSTTTASSLQATLNEDIELVHIPELENKALEVVRGWENKVIETEKQ